MGRHSDNVGMFGRRHVHLVHAYEARHVDVDRQPTGRPRLDVDRIPDELFDPFIDRGPDDPDVGAR